MAAVTAGTLALKFLADIDNAMSGMKKVRDEAAKTAEAMQKEGAKGKGFFKELSAGLGKKSALGQTLKLAAGGGAIAGLGLAAKELEEFTAKIVEMQEESHRAGVSMLSFGDDIVRTIPILGRLRSAGLNIRSLLFGEKTDEQLAKEAEAMQKVGDETQRVLDSVKELHHAFPGIGLTGRAKQAFDEEEALRKQIDAINEERRAAQSIGDIAQRNQRLKALDAKANELYRAQERRDELDALSVMEEAQKKEQELYDAKQKDIQSVIDTLRRENEEWGKSADEIERAALAAKGATDEQMGFLKILQSQRTENERIEQIRAANNERQDRLDRAQEEIDKERRDRLTNLTRSILESKPIGLTGAEAFGSSAAASVIANAAAGRSAAPDMKTALDIAKRQLAAQERQEALLRKLVEDE